jgi:hypothetical protein
MHTVDEGGEMTLLPNTATMPSDWETTANPRRAPKPVRQVIVKLSLVRNEDTNQQLVNLGKLLLSPQNAVTATGHAQMPGLLQLADRCMSTQLHIAEHSYIHMHALLQFAIWVE